LANNKSKHCALSKINIIYKIQFLFMNAQLIKEALAVVLWVFDFVFL